MQPAYSQQVTFIYVRDLAEGSRFLEHVLGLPFVLEQGGGCRIHQVNPGAYLGVCTNRPPPDDKGVTYSLVVPDVAVAYQTLKERGAEFEAPPKFSERFQVTSAFVKGPEGYRFEIQSFVDSAWPAPVEFGSTSSGDD